MPDCIIHLSRLQKNMGKTRNTSLDTVVTDFILLGLSHPPRLRTLLFLLFFIIYILTQLGNLLILLTVWADPKLHTRPMYILLGVLSFLDMWLSSVIVPRIFTIPTPIPRRIRLLQNSLKLLQKWLIPTIP